MNWYENLIKNTQLDQSMLVNRETCDILFHPSLILQIVLVAQSCLTLDSPMNCSPKTPLSMGFSRILVWVSMPVSPALQAYSLPTEPSWKPIIL